MRAPEKSEVDRHAVAARGERPERKHALETGHGVERVAEGELVHLTPAPAPALAAESPLQLAARLIEAGFDKSPARQVGEPRRSLVAEDSLDRKQRLVKNFDIGAKQLLAQRGREEVHCQAMIKTMEQRGG